MVLRTRMGALARQAPRYKAPVASFVVALSIASTLLALTASPVSAETPTRGAAQAAADWLQSQQNPDGSWGETVPFRDTPTLTLGAYLGTTAHALLSAPLSLQAACMTQVVILAAGLTVSLALSYFIPDVMIPWTENMGC